MSCSRELLEAVGRLAIEHNLVVLKRTAFDTTPVNDGDQIEIVHRLAEATGRSGDRDAASGGMCRQLRDDRAQERQHLADAEHVGGVVIGDLEVDDVGVVAVAPAGAGIEDQPVRMGGDQLLDVAVIGVLRDVRAVLGSYADHLPV